MNLNELRADFTQLLDELLDDVVVDDVRNVNPPCVLVGLPTIDWASHAVTQMVHVIAPSGTADDVDWMLATLTTITTGPLGNRYRPTTAGPGTYGVSTDRLYPAYEITYRIPQPATFCLAVSPPVPVPPAPRVTLTVDDVTDLTVTVTVGNTDPDAPTPSVDWGDSYETTDLTHTYDTAGAYRVVARQYGRRDSLPQTVTVTEPPPPPQLDLEVVDQTDLTVTVDVTGDDTELPVSIDWGDGAADTTTTHTYADAGTYTLVATQPGRTDSAPVQVTVTEPPPPPPQLVLAVTDVEDLVVTVEVTDDDPELPVSIDWDDGTSDELDTHTYTAAGTYTLIAEQVGRTDSDPVQVTVTEPPPPAVGPFPNTSCGVYDVTAWDSYPLITTCASAATGPLYTIHPHASTPPTIAHNAGNLTAAEATALGATRMRVWFAPDQQPGNNTPYDGPVTEVGTGVGVRLATIAGGHLWDPGTYTITTDMYDATDTLIASYTANLTVT